MSSADRIGSPSYLCMPHLLLGHTSFPPHRGTAHTHPEKVGVGGGSHHSLAALIKPSPPVGVTSCVSEISEQE